MPQRKDQKSNTRSNSINEKKTFSIKALQGQVDNLVKPPLSKPSEKKVLDKSELDELCASWLELSMDHELENDLKEKIKDQLCKLAAEQNQTINEYSKPNAYWKLVDFFAWREALKGSSETVLDLETNFLNQLEKEQWSAFGLVLKDRGVTHLGLANTRLGLLTSEQWIAFCEVLKGSTVIDLGLAENFLVQLKKEQWMAFGLALKDCGVTHLGLSNNYLGLLTSEQWIAFCEVLKGSDLTHLGLANNYLGLLTSEQWKAFCEVLKDSDITHLSLSHNELNLLSEEKWTIFCENLKDSCVTNLYFKELNLLSEEKWTIFCENLKGSRITRLYFNESELTQEKMDLLATILVSNGYKKPPEDQKKENNGYNQDLQGVRFFSQPNSDKKAEEKYETSLECIIF